MKKYLLLLLVPLFLNSATIQEQKIAYITSIIQKQDMVAGAIDMYLTLYGTVPADINALKSANLLTSSFTYSGTFSVNTSTQTITLVDTVSSPEVYQSDYYINTNEKEKYSVHSVVSTTDFTAEYSFTPKAIYSNTASSSMTVSPSEPSSPSNGDMYLNSLTKQIYYYSGSWVSVNPKKLWIVRDVAELPSTATLNDGGIVLKTTSLKKYLYDGSSWDEIPQTIPFTYNGQF